MDTFWEKVFENQEAEGVIMSVHKDVKRGTWFAKIKYTDWTGAPCSTTKRGFARKKDAQEYEEAFLRKQQGAANMTFQSLYDFYMQDCQTRLRETTCKNKRWIFTKKILPFFGKLPCNEITPADIRKWQNTLMKKGYTPTYLKTVNNQLSAILNFAVRYYNLAGNPMHRTKSIGKSYADAMQFWTLQEFQQFIRHTTTLAYQTVFTLLYWSGMREGELLALTYQDFDFIRGIVHISKSYAKIDGKDLIGPPKTPASIRDISLPKQVMDLVQEFSSTIFKLDVKKRLFELTKSHLYKEMQRAAKAANVKRIRIHDLRHSHASYLIEHGLPILKVSKRLGHEKIETTLRTYAHLYPQEHDEALAIMEKDVNISLPTKQPCDAKDSPSSP